MCENCQPLFSAFAPYPMNEIVKGSIDLIRQLNYGLVYASLEEHKELSRTDLSRLTGLSPASITKITRELLDGGWWSPVVKVRWGAAVVRPCCALTSAASSFSPCVLAVATWIWRCLTSPVARWPASATSLPRRSAPICWAVWYTPSRCFCRESPSVWPVSPSACRVR